MIKRMLKSLLYMAVCCVLCSQSLTAMATETIIPSTKNYGVDMQGAKNVYLCNKTPVEWKEGSKFFLTYTVTELESDLSVQSGVIITQDYRLDYPYQQGTMKYRQKSALLEEGCTYFYRFEITEEGLQCTASWAKGNKSDYIGLPLTEGTILDGCKYFGVWFGGTADTNIVGCLTRVRCYDESGTDLGVAIGSETYAAASMVYDPEEREALQPNDKIKNRYSITLNDNYNVLIGNKRYTDSDVVFMEYTVKSVTKDTLYQSGLIYHSSPLAEYTDGFWRQELHDTENYGGCRLLQPGVTYLIRYTVTEEGMDVVLKYKENGEDVYYYYPRFFGEPNDGCGFFSIWLGEGVNSKVSAELVDFKCYDKDGNNLGVQVNQNATIVHQGGLEDYSRCHAAYYNSDQDTIIWLLDDQKVSVVTGETVENGSYVIDGSSLTMNIGGKTEEYHYLYRSMTDDEGNKYMRLRDQTVSFVSGIVTGDELQEVTVSSKTGYQASEPEAPVMEGNTFVAWCYADGTDFDFDKIVTESVTLYAKWQDGDGNTFLAVDLVSEGADMTGLIVGGVCALLLLATAVGCVLIVKKAKQGGENLE